MTSQMKAWLQQVFSVPRLPGLVFNEASLEGSPRTLSLTSISGGSHARPSVRTPKSEASSEPLVREPGLRVSTAVHMGNVWRAFTTPEA